MGLIEINNDPLDICILNFFMEVDHKHAYTLRLGVSYLQDMSRVLYIEEVILG